MSNEEKAHDIARLEELTLMGCVMKNLSWAQFNQVGAEWLQTFLENLDAKTSKGALLNAVEEANREWEL